MLHLRLLAAAVLCATLVDALSASTPSAGVLGGARLRSAVRCVAADVGAMQLPPELEKTVRAFKMVPDQKMRYKQLLFYAAKLPPMDSALCVDENKVPGCLSVVHVHAMREGDAISYQGSSDSQLTKGLVALLINGLSGCTNEQIQRVDKGLIVAAGLLLGLSMRIRACLPAASSRA